MAYVRKTQDEHQIHGNYGHGWEEVDSTDNIKDAKYLLREYRLSAHYASFKIVKKRVRIENDAA